MESLCQYLVSRLEITETQRQEIAPEHQPLVVMKRLVSSLKDAENAWLREYSQTLEAKIRGRELPGKPMELEGILPDGSRFNIKDLHGKPAVVCFYKTYPIPNLPPGVLVKRETALPYLLEKLKSYDADYASKDLEIVVYLVGKEHQDFPEPDETMQRWKITIAEDSVAEGLKDYWEHYGLRSSPTWFLIDRNGNVVDTKNDSRGAPDKTLEALMNGE